MGIYSDFVKSEQQNQPPVGEFQDTVGTSLRKGFSAGLRGAGSQIASLAGAAGEALGADEFAANRNAQAAALQREAQEVGPTIRHSSQVTGLRSGLNYAAGLLSSSAPVSLGAMGAAALGGGAAVPAMLRAAAFTAPFEMGDVAQKIQADPEALQRGAGERLGDAVMGGGVSALAQGVVPGLIGAKLAGAGARAAAGQTFGQVVGKNVVGAAAMEGGAEGTGDAIKQYAANQERPLDWDSIKENAIGGAVAGGAMGTIGAGADLAARTAPQALDAFGRARTSINERVQAARTAAGDVPGQVGDLAADGAAAGRAGIDKAADMVRSGAATVKREFDAAAASETGQAIKGKLNDVANSTVGKKVKSVYDRAADMFERNRTQTDADIADKIMRGEDLDIDPAMVATASDDQIAEMVRKSDGRKVEIATRMAKEMLSKFKPGEPMYEKVSEAAKNVANEGGAAAVAALKKTADAAEAVGSRMKDALESMDERYPAAGKAVRRAADGVRTAAAKRRAETSASSGQFSKEDTFDVGGSPVDDRTFDAQGTFVDENAGTFTDEGAQDRPRLLGPKGQEGRAEPTGLAAIKAARQEFIDAAKANGGTEEDGRTAFKEAQAGGMRPTPAEARAYVANKYGKKSLDDSGTQAAIMRALQESGLGTRRPEFFEVEENINNLGKLLRRSVEQMTSGAADRKTYESLVGLLGPDTEPLLNSIKRTLYEDLEPGEAENYFRGLAELADVEKQDTDLLNTLGQLMTPESLAMSPERVRELTDLFVEHAQSNVETPTNVRNMATMALGTGEAQRLADSRMVDRLYQQHFGEKTDAAYAAVEKHVKSLYRGTKDPLSTAPFETDENGNVMEGDDTEVVTQAEGQFDGEGNRLEEAPRDVMRFGLTRTSAAQDGKRKVELDGLPYSMKGRYAQENQRYAKQHLADLQAKYPDKTVRMVDGYIEVENRDTPGEFNDADIEAMRLDTKEFSRSPSRIEIPQEGGKKLILDAVKIAKTFRKKNTSDFEPDTPKNRTQNTIEAFKQGVAQMMEQFGTTFAVDDGAVIGYVANKPLTWGAAKTMSFPTSADRESDADARLVEELRAQYRAAKAEGDEKVMRQIAVDAKGLLNRAAFNKDRELAGGDNFTPTHAARSVAKVERAVERALAKAEADHKKRGVELPDTAREKIALKARNEFIREEVGGFDDMRETDFDKDGVLNATGLQNLLTDQGRREFGKDENIALASVASKEEKMVNRSSMDGSPQYVNDFADKNGAILNLASALEAKTTAGARAVGKRLRGLMEPLTQRVMTDKDKAELARVLGQGTRTEADGVVGGNSAKPSEIAAIVNPLAEKYSPENVRAIVKKRSKVEPKEKTVSPREGIEGDITDSFDDINAELMSVSASRAVGEGPATSRVATAKQTSRAASADFEGMPVPDLMSTDITKLDDAALDEWVRVVGDRANQYPLWDHYNRDKYLNAVSRAQEGTPDPKAVAAKKAAFLKRAASGDKALIKELRSSPDAKGLQRAMETLTAHNFDGVGEGDAAANNALDVLDAINDRLAELVQDPDVAYGLQTRKYSLMATAVHESLGRPGFAATHDSPIRHEGKFDWRKHTGKGEGHAAFGAGTYLSTADGVHKSYKNQFSAVVNSQRPADNDYKIDELTEERKDALGRAAMWRNAKIVDGFYDDGFGKMSEVEVREAQTKHERIAADLQKEIAALEKIKSPTYEVSVNIKPEQLLDWDAPLDKQIGVVGSAISALYKTAEFKRIVEDLALQQEWGASGFGYVGNSWTFDGNTVWVKPTRGLTAGATVVRQSEAAKFTGSSPKDALNKAITSTLTGEDLYRALADDLGSQAKASEYLQSLGILGHRYAAESGKNADMPNYVIYDDSKITTNYVHFSKEKTDPNTTNKTGGAPEVKAYIERVLGPGVKLAWAKMTHAGDFTRMKTHDLIRISVHALDPMSVAYHESLHGFFAKLRDAGATDIIGVLEKAAASPQVMAQLKERFKDQPAVLEQLKDPEERAAYMYQMWANDPTTFKITIKERTVFRRIAAFFRKLLGMWSNDERALHIMNYFHSGQYAQNMASPHAVRGALMAPGHNRAAEALQKMVVPMANLADAVVGTGSGRLRDTDIPSLIRLADLIKRPGTQIGGDQGFIAAARIEATKRRSDVGMIFENFSEAELQEAMEALQSGKSAPSTGGQAAADAVKQFLRGMRNYMKQAGTDIGDLGPDYFPRVWDAHYISKNQQAFKDMLEPYIRSGEMQGSAEQLIRNLTSRDGNEFGIETHVPGMQNKKSRVLSFIKPGDAAQFLKKDLASTLNDYLTQATRRAEWDRRLGWDAKAGQTKLNTLLIDAKSEGATDAQLEMTREYLKGIDGTLGDTINPDVRRVMGNMIVYQNVRLLPLAIFSMAVDPMGQMVRGGTLAQSYATLVRGIKSIPESWGGKVKSDEATELAELVGVVDSAVMNTVMGDIYTQGMVGGTARMINDKFFKLNLVEGMSRAFRIGASQAAMSFMLKHSTSVKNAHSVRWMAELGIQAGDIKMAPNSSRIALTQAEGLSEAQEQRVHAAINQWVDGAMLRPDAADKPIWMNDPRFALISHLKQFVFAFQKTILARIAHEIRHGNYSPMMVLASYVPIMMAVDTTKGLLQSGGEVPEWKKGWGPAEYTGYAMERAGLFGVGQFGLDMAQESEYGGFAPIGVAGPTIEQLTDVMQVMGGDKQFGSVLLNSMPANALYRNILDQDVEANSGATLSN